MGEVFSTDVSNSAQKNSREQLRLSRGSFRTLNVCTCYKKTLWEDAVSHVLAAALNPLVTLWA